MWEGGTCGRAWHECVRSSMIERLEMRVFPRTTVSGRRMSPKPPAKPSSTPYWLLRRADQGTVAVLILVGLGTTVGWWVSQGGWQGRLIEVERAQPLAASFEVDLNRADWPELAQLPGVGRTLAQRIVESRDGEGPFLDHADLMRVQGIGPKTLDAVRPYLRPMPPGSDVAGQ
jgi:competence protein ComEA